MECEALESSTVNIDMKDYLKMLISNTDENFLQGIDTLFAGEARTFKFDSGKKVWAERGLGVIFIVKLISEPSCRLVQWRFETKTVAINHFILKDVGIIPVQANANTYCWTSIGKDFTTPFKYAARFEEEVGFYFKDAFEKCANIGGISMKDLVAMKKRSEDLYKSAATKEIEDSEMAFDSEVDTEENQESSEENAEKPSDLYEETTDEVFHGRDIKKKKSFFRKVFGCSVC